MIISILLTILTNEANIIQQAQRGSLASFNQLVMAYQNLAYNVAYRIMGNPETAADACQDAFVKAYKSLHQYQGGSFKNWLLRIVTNSCYDHIRYHKRRPASSLDDMMSDEAAPFDVASDAELPEARLLRGELGQLLQQVINQLPEDQRVVLTLSDVHQLSYQEISEITQQPLGTIKSRLSRARRKVRDALTKHQELLPSQYR